MNKKDYYVNKISKASDRRGNLLIEMMDIYNVSNLMALTAKQVRKFYEERVENEQNDRKDSRILRL